MKRKILIVIIVLVLLCPFHVGVYRDGGTKTYFSLTYKVVRWKKMMPIHGDELIDPYTGLRYVDYYMKTRLYLLPYNFKSLDDLWELEKSRAN